MPCRNRSCSSGRRHSWAIQDLAKEQLPSGYAYEFTGQTREELSSGGQSAIIFMLCLVFVYFLLSAQYESYILPLAVILSIPTGILGVFVVLGLTGIENNIYVQVALIMLIGLLAKNAILIVEFAVQRRRAGLPLIAAAIEAARLRLRPILMTSFAFVFGLFPVEYCNRAFWHWGNHSIQHRRGRKGMVSGVLLGVFTYPGAFCHIPASAGKGNGVMPSAILNNEQASEHINSVDVLELQEEYSK